MNIQVSNTLKALIFDTRTVDRGEVMLMECAVSESCHRGNSSVVFAKLVRLLVKFQRRLVARVARREAKDLWLLLKNPRKHVLKQAKEEFDTVCLQLERHFEYLQRYWLPVQHSFSHTFRMDDDGVIAVPARIRDLADSLWVEEK